MEEDKKYKHILAHPNVMEDNEYREPIPLAYKITLVDVTNKYNIKHDYISWRYIDEYLKNFEVWYGNVEDKEPLDSPEKGLKTLVKLKRGAMGGRVRYKIKKIEIAPTIPIEEFKKYAFHYFRYTKNDVIRELRNLRLKLYYIISIVKNNNDENENNKDEELAKIKKYFYDNVEFNEGKWLDDIIENEIEAFKDNRCDWIL